MQICRKSKISETNTKSTLPLLHAQHILQIIFSSLEGYRLQFSIARAYFMYTVWHCTGQHHSSMYVCMYHLFAVTWCPLVSVITTLYYAAKSIFHHQVRYCMLSLRYAWIQSLGIILIHQLVPNFVSFATTIAELAHGEKSCTHSLTHSISQSLTQLIWCPGNRSLCLGIKHRNNFLSHATMFRTLVKCHQKQSQLNGVS